jgi:ribose/xylose/arabinose/galactoside ABC-type transport system permease subunit
MESNHSRIRALKNLIGQSSAGIFIVMLVLVCLFQLVNPRFLSSVNIATMLRALSYTGIIAIGMALCLISGVIDLSVGSTAAFASVVFGIALRDWQIGIIFSLVIVLIIGTLIGLINSFVILRLNITPFIATISMMFVIRGLANWASNGYTVYPLPNGILSIGEAKPLGVSWAFWIFIALLILAELILRFSLLGLLLRAVGSDREVAECTEVNTNQVNTFSLVLISILAAIAGALISIMSNAGSPTVGSGWEFAAITACAIGGVSLFGYHGNMLGLFCGLAVIQIISNGIVMIGVNPYLQNVVIGAILLTAMYADIKRRSYLDLDTI